MRVRTKDKSNGTTESDSEEETQFGVVWEKVIIPETEEQEGHKDEVHIPSIETDATKKAITVEIEETPTGEACVGKFVMKIFEQGLFKGTITTATKKRGRYLYHVLYEDGDAEDLNETEFREAYELFTGQLLEKRSTCDTSEALHDQDDDSDKELEKSGGETEGSEYDLSEDDEIQRKKKKRRTLCTKKTKEKALRNGGPINQKEEEAQNPRKKKQQTTKPMVINVEELFKSGNKKSVTNKTIESMTPDEKKEILGSAEKSLVKQAKKGLRVQAMKVS